MTPTAPHNPPPSIDSADRPGSDGFVVGVYAALAVTLVCVLAALLVVGCAPASQKADAAAVLHNQAVHRAEAKVQADTDRILTAVRNARVWLDTLRAKVDAYLADPAHNPAPTPQETKAALDRADGQLAPVDALGASVKQNSTAAASAADAQKSADDEAKRLARDEQRKADERTGAILVGFAVAGLVFLAVERFTKFTFLAALVPAAAAGALAFCLFGYVLALIVGVLKIVMWVACGLAAAGVAAYVVARHRKGGLPAWLRNVELVAPQAAKADAP